MAEHVRIDEGVERGPRTPPPPPEPTQVVKSGMLEGINVQDLIKRYLDGETSKDIALSLGCSTQLLSYYLRRHSENDWKEAQIIQALERKETAQMEIDRAEHPLALARGRERLKAAQWDLERIYSKHYGIKQELSVTHTMPQDVVKEIAALTAELGVARGLQVAAQHGEVIDVVPEQQIIDGK